MLLLLFLTLPFVFSKTPTCPDSTWFLFSRTPTAKNNYTSDYCVSMFFHAKSGTREYARGLCAYYNASLTIPENQYEFRLWSAVLNAGNHSDILLATDGEISPHCKAKMIRNKEFRPRNVTAGECSIHTDLFIFDDYHTDPTFLIKKYNDTIPDPRTVDAFDDTEKLAYDGTCLIMDSDVYNTTDLEPHLKDEKFMKRHTNHTGNFHLSYCNGVNTNIVPPNRPILGVLCGTLPEWK